jgi:2-dehydropantoate 2-reductase
VSGDLNAIGQADVIVLGVKAHSLTTLAPQLRPLLGPDTVVVSTQNGIPWWYFQNYGGELDGMRLERVDPGGVISAAIEPRRVVGSLAYFATDIVEPGVIRHTEGNKISFGEPDGTRSERARKIAEPLIAAGFRCPITQRFRHEIWVKLLGNVAFNPISALTGGTLEELVRHPDVSKVVRALMLRRRPSPSGEHRFAHFDRPADGRRERSAHGTSMLQDLEAGRPMGSAIVGAVSNSANGSAWRCRPRSGVRCGAGRQTDPRRPAVSSAIRSGRSSRSGARTVRARMRFLALDV